MRYLVEFANVRAQHDKGPVPLHLECRVMHMHTHSGRYEYYVLFLWHYPAIKYAY